MTTERYPEGRVTVRILDEAGESVTEVSGIVAREFAQVIAWLLQERLEYQSQKWDYKSQDLEHALQGLDEDSWFWQRGVENYTGRVRLFGVEHPLGVQALLKLAATIACIPEHLLRGKIIESLPKPGLSSGNLE